MAADDVFDAVIDDPDVHISSAIKNGSYNISDSSELTILLEQEGGFRTVLHPVVELVISENKAFDDIAYSMLYAQFNDQRVQASQSFTSKVVNGVETVTYTLEDDFAASNDFYIGLSYFDAQLDDYNNEKIQKVEIVSSDGTVLGDVTDEAIIANGNTMWEEDAGFLFNGAGVNFLITTDTRDYQLAVRIKGVQEAVARDFRVTGIAGVAEAFIMPDDVDSMSKYYQTIFVDDTDLSSVKLKFLASEGANVQTAAAKSQISGISAVGENNSLNAFTSVAADKIDSIAKIRLIGDGGGEISGTLTQIKSIALQRSG